MPNRDGTGPIGQGTFSGKGFGNCIKYGIPLIAGVAACFGKRGFGRGQGRSLGLRNLAFNEDNESQQTYSDKNKELTILKNQANKIEDSLEGIKNRIAELEKE